VNPPNIVENRLSLPDLVADECPGATVEIFFDTPSVLVKFRNRSILLPASTIELGEAAIRARLRSLVPRSVKTTRGRKPKVKAVVSLEEGEINGIK
jgi:hypothetical protein